MQDLPVNSLSAAALQLYAVPAAALHKCNCNMYYIVLHVSYSADADRVVPCGFAKHKHLSIHLASAHILLPGVQASMADKAMQALQHTHDHFAKRRWQAERHPTTFAVILDVQQTPQGTFRVATCASPKLTTSLWAIIQA